MADAYDDNRIAPVIHGKVGKIEINGMAVHWTPATFFFQCLVLAAVS